MIGKEHDGAVPPGRVVEVRYLYATRDLILNQPRFERLRSDRTPEACRRRQPRPVSKSPLL